jgi:3-oxoacyl-[acyl-carrier protein] reductase
VGETSADRVLVVTGAGSGMGRAAVERAVGAYRLVVALDRDEAALASLSRDVGPAVLPVRCDITAPDELAAISQRLEAEDRSPHGLLNFAGLSDFVPATSMTPEAWDRQVAVNLTGTFNACQAFGAAMVRNGSGAIVNVASTAGLSGVPGMAAYTAAKHGVVGLTRALAVEWGRAGVRVNCICPGATLTPMLLATSDDYRAERVRRVPLGRLGEPDEQVAVALFLASDAASYVTGAIVPVDGGVSAMAPGTAEAAIHS